MNKILVVDDVSYHRQILKNKLEKHGDFIFIEAENGIKGFLKYGIHKPNIIFMDYEMPVLNGYESLKMIKEKYSDAKVVMVTSVNSKEVVKECIKAGAMDFISKPIDEKYLVRALTKAIL